MPLFSLGQNLKSKKIKIKIVEKKGVRGTPEVPERFLLRFFLTYLTFLITKYT